MEERMNRFAMCGLDCGECEYQEKMGCSTCHKARGKIFWGQCSIAKCVMGKRLDNCSRCGEFPCHKLNAFAFDKDQGDNGKRIENLRSLF